MANIAVTDLTFAVTKRLGRTGGTRGLNVVYGTILIPATTVDYAAGGVPISGVTNSATGAVIAANALACPGLACPNELVRLRVLSNGLAASLDDAFLVLFDSGTKADGTAPTAPHKLRIMVPGTFTGSALAAHTHALHFNNADVADSAGARINAGTNLLGANTGADIAVAGVADTTGAGGIVTITAGTPAGTVAIRQVEHANGALAEALTVYVYAEGW